MDRGTLTRTAILIIALVNQLLISFELNPVPGNEETWYHVVSTIFTIAASLISWFRNNYITSRGQAQLKVLKREHLTNVD